MKTLHLTINGHATTVPEGSSLLEACQASGAKIPTLCYDKRLQAFGGCRLCVVEVEGARSLAASCATPAVSGMVVHTHSKKVLNSRKITLELLWSNHCNDCLSCEKAGNCRLQDYCYEYGIESNDETFPRHIEKKSDETNSFYRFEQDKCILCGQCVNVCSKLVGFTAIDFTDRGHETHIGHPFDAGMEHSDCISCGNCVSVCPTGALMEKSKVRFRNWDIEKKVRTTCAYCGVGCQMDLMVKDNQVVRVDPAMDAVNNGMLCVKGKFGYKFIDSPDRLTTPLIHKNGELIAATWDEALDLIAEKMKTTKAQYGPDSLAGLSSARCTNEENYLMQKLFRSIIGTNNVDHCARLCHASTVAGLAASFGSGAMTNSIEDILGADVLFVTGSNPTENHPVIGSMMIQAKKRGAAIIVADPRRIPLVRHADIYLPIQPGTNVALLNAMMHVILAENLHDMEYITSRTEDFESLVMMVQEYTPDKAAKICGVPAEDIRRAARLYAGAKKAGIYYAMGVTQHSDGTNHVKSVANLAMLCGNVGIENAGVNPLRGQNNVQGACDMGGLPNVYPGYQKVDDPEIQKRFEAAWGTTALSSKPGFTIPKIMDGAIDGSLKCLYIMGENPMISDPDITHIEHALESLDFLVVQDIFLTETAQKAHVVLPAACFAEKDGTFTNTERRIQRVRKAVNPPGDAWSDTNIFVALAQRLGASWSYDTSADVMSEIAAVTPSYRGIAYNRIENQGIQWPCPSEDHPGTPTLHAGQFTRGKGKFSAIPHKGPAELTDEAYPLTLTTGRILYHYHTRTMTGRVDGLNEMAGESFVEVTPADAQRYGLAEGDRVQVETRRGSINVALRITPKIKEGVVFIPFHFAEGAANRLTNAALDPISDIPEFKVCAVKLSKAEV